MYLKKIIEQKKKDIAGLRIADRVRTRPVFDCMPQLCARPFIAEIKKASPSAGDIRADADVVKTAVLYAENGAGAISVLTDRQFFKGSLDDLDAVSDSVRIPVLCKDFILSEAQIENAYLYGADIVLLIVAVLEKDEIRLLSKKAESLGLGVLYEIHYVEEMVKLEGLDLRMLGVNSRDLMTFEINKGYAAFVLSQVRGNFLRVAESGILNTDDVINLRQAGADVFLIGTALMKAEDPGRKLAEFSAALEGLRVH